VHVEAVLILLSPLLTIMPIEAAASSLLLSLWFCMCQKANANTPQSATADFLKKGKRTSTKFLQQYSLVASHFVHVEAVVLITHHYY
jgi:hypothetical protein